MSWRGRSTALACHNIEEFKSYLRGLNFSWRPSGMVLHNTASPTLKQWWHGGTLPAQRIKNLRSYYENDLGWSAGPHAFVDGVTIWVFTDFNVRGVHSPSWNSSRLGIEMVGDYAVEDDETGEGAKVMAMTVALFSECHAFFGWEPSNVSIKLHKEDTQTTHDCPGKKIVKSEFISDVVHYMGEGGDHGDIPISPTSGEVHNVPAGEKLNVRSVPTVVADIIGTLDNGQKVVIVGDALNGSQKWFRLQFGVGVQVYGWAHSAYIKTDAEQPAEPTAEIWHNNITATVFGGAGDSQGSSYGGIVDPTSPGVALPYKWRNKPRPHINVVGPRGSIVANVVDVGPWNIDDPDYVLGRARPMVEAQYANKTRAQNGRIPTNDAAIDLTPAAASAIGISGKGKVKWQIT